MSKSVYRRKLVSATEAIPRKKQHTKPCGDCPFSRDSLKGWLGGQTPEQVVREAHGDGLIMCHTCGNQQCAGAAIFRDNVCKLPRDRTALLLGQNKEIVFARDHEFLEHHNTANDLEEVDAER